MTRPQGTVKLYDSSINVWEEPPGRCDDDYEKGLLREVFGPLIRAMRDRGWKVGRDERIHRDYRCLSKSRRYCVHPSGIEAKIEQSGRYIGLELYQNVANVEHLHGGYYDHNKLERMPYLMRLRALLEIEALSAWLCTRFGYGLKRDKKKLGPGGLDCDGYIAQHRDRDMFGDGITDPIADYNSGGRDCVLQNGMRVYFMDSKGRWLTGIAEHNINNMWWVKCGRFTLKNEGSHDLQEKPPADLRKKGGHFRRERIENLMRQAADRNDFLRADQLRRVLFNGCEVFRIRHREKGWYGIQSMGYAGDRAGAGQYTRDEARFAFERPDDYEVEAVDG